MDLVYAQKFAYALSSISLGTSVIPRKHWKQRLRIFFGGGGGVGGLNEVHSGLGENN